MKMTVLRKMGYEGTNVYILQFDYTFQYQFPWKNEIYMNRIEMKPRLWRATLALLGIIPNYTKLQLTNGEQVMLSGAMATIDELKKQKNIKLKAPAKPKKDTKCMWQSTFLGKEQVPHYRCITHDEYVPIEFNKRPVHDIKK